MSYSQEFKINLQKLNADEMLLVLLEIEHPLLAEPIRIVNDNRGLISNGNNYLAMPFEIQRQSDIQGELPKVQLVVSNIGRTLVRWIDTTGGAKGSILKAKLARRSSPDLIEETLDLNVSTVTIDTMSVTFNLVVQNNLTKRAVRYVFDKVKSPGLF